jgi:hypothetical protein
MPQFKVQWKTPRRTPGDFNLQSTMIEAESALDAVYHVGKRQGMFGARDVTVEEMPKYKDGFYLTYYGRPLSKRNGTWYTFNGEQWTLFLFKDSEPSDLTFIGPLL